MVLAAFAFAILYALLAPALFVLATLLLRWETLRWLLVSVLLVPALTVLGLFGLLAGLPAIALLIGAIAARTPSRRWPTLLAACVLPLGELLLRRQHGLTHVAARVLPLLMDHRTLFILGTAAPVVSSMVAALLIPRRLLVVMLGRRRRANDVPRVRMAGVPG